MLSVRAVYVLRSLGLADTQEECEASIEHEVQYHRSHGRTIVNLEAGEVFYQVSTQRAVRLTLTLETRVRIGPRRIRGGGGSDIFKRNIKKRIDERFGEFFTPR